MIDLGPNTTVIWGAGCAGTLLALELKQIDPGHEIHLFDTRKVFDQTQRWCFFNHNHSVQLPGTTHHWDCWKIIGKNTHRFRSNRYTYTHVDSQKFFKSAHESLMKFGDVHFHLGSVIQPDLDDSQSGRFKFDDSVYRSDNIVDARGISKNVTIEDGLYQSFLGVIDESVALNPRQAPVLMDFNVPQHLGVTFLYQLPLGDGKMLSELTVFSPQKTSIQELEPILAAVLKERGMTLSTSACTEQGIIPMTLKKESSLSPHRRIGATGGAVRPSSGYGFLGSYKQARRMAPDIIQQRETLFSPHEKYSHLDRIFLNVCKKRPEMMPQIFEQMFSGNRADTMASFLSESSSALEIAAIIHSLPKWPFLREAADPILTSSQPAPLCTTGYGT